MDILQSEFIWVEQCFFVKLLNLQYMHIVINCKLCKLHTATILIKSIKSNCKYLVNNKGMDRVTNIVSYDWVSMHFQQVSRYRLPVMILRLNWTLKTEHCSLLLLYREITQFDDESASMKTQTYTLTTANNNNSNK